MEKKGFFAEFKEFALRGSVMDLAVGVIIGAAFQAIVNSLVDDILSPILGIVLRGDLSSLALNLWDGRVSIRFGSFITAIINFVIMALVIFCIVKGINALKNIGSKKNTDGTAEPTEKDCPFCQSKIAYKATRCPNCTSQLN